VFKHETHSGILVGAVGAIEREGEVERMGLLFLKDEVEKVDVVDIVFEDDMNALNEKNK
jgi:hypothetical protein